MKTKQIVSRSRRRIPNVSRVTARKNLVEKLTHDILARSEPEPYLLPSEAEMCHEYKLSRVTVRLALFDLQHKGLIYKEHGRGTFVYGRSRQAVKGLALLVQTGDPATCGPLAELLRGMRAVSGTPVTLLSTPIKTWSQDFLNSIAGCVIFSDVIDSDDLVIFQKRGIPFQLAFRNEAGHAAIHLGQTDIARASATRLLEFNHRRIALVTGLHPCLDARKKEGIAQALNQYSVPSGSVTEIRMHGDRNKDLSAILAHLQSEHYSTGWIAFDDSYALLIYAAARRLGLDIYRDLSVASFQQNSYLQFIEPRMETVAFDFFEAGRLAAEGLHDSFLTGAPVKTVSVAPQRIEGLSVSEAQVLLQSKVPG